MNEFERIYEQLPTTGWLTRDEAELLYRTVKGLPADCDLVEVGSYYGRSAVLLALARPDSTLHCVDPWDDSFGDAPGLERFNDFVANLDDRDIANVVPHRLRVEDCLLMSYSVGFAYLDGDHTAQGTQSQIDFALRFPNMQTIAIHDVNDSGDGVAIKEMALRMLGPWRERVGRLAVWELSQ